MRRDPLMTAVVAAAMASVVAVSVFVAAITWKRHETAISAKVDCRPLVEMIDASFADGRISKTEATDIEDASEAMRAKADARNADAITRCVGLEEGHPLAS
jgi:hypothetical protein